MDHSDLPLPTLRNDTFTMADMYANYTGKKAAATTGPDRKEHDDLVKALRADDLKRRLAEAKELLKVNGP